MCFACASALRNGCLINEHHLLTHAITFIYYLLYLATEREKEWRGESWPCMSKWRVEAKLRIKIFREQPKVFSTRDSFML